MKRKTKRIIAGTAMAAAAVSLSACIFNPKEEINVDVYGPPADFEESQDGLIRKENRDWTEGIIQEYVPSEERNETGMEMGATPLSASEVAQAKSIISQELDTSDIPDNSEADFALYMFSSGDTDTFYISSSERKVWTEEGTLIDTVSIDFICGLVEKIPSSF